jgi:membrane-bound ClpP family serine protease
MAAGLGLAAAAYVVLQVLFSCTEVGVERGLEELIGEIAEITTPIPAQGLGEVVYVSRGQRDLAAARSISEEPVPRGSLVRIEDVAGTILHVRRLDTLD